MGFRMKKLLVVTAGLILLGDMAFATWDDAASRGLFPYFQAGGDWLTLLVFVNGSEETDDVIYICTQDEHAGWADVVADTCSISPNQMLLFCTAMGIGRWIPTVSGFGYVKFRCEHGGFIHPYCVILNRLTWKGYVVPAYRQDHGF